MHIEVKENQSLLSLKGWNFPFWHGGELVGWNTNISWSIKPIFHHENLLSFLNISNQRHINKTDSEIKVRDGYICIICLKHFARSGFMIDNFYLLAHSCLLHSLIRHETKVDVREVGPLTHRARHTTKIQNELGNHSIYLNVETRN